MHLIEEAFGEGCNLYEVLGCSKDADSAKLRKAYYRKALKFHPDKNKDDPEAATSFQAVSLTYQILSDAELRREYDDTGVIPHNDALGDQEETQGESAWRAYFTNLFGSVTSSKIDSFASKYKCSDEEKRDVLKEFKKCQGNLVKMLNFVMLSEPRDAVRWVEDYLRPGMEAGDVDATLNEGMEKSLLKIRKQIEKENAKQNKSESEEDDDDEDATETEESEKEEEESKTPSSSSKKRKQGKTSASATTAKTSSSTKKAKGRKKQANSSVDDLVAQIQNKKRGNNNILADLGARYGVAVGDDPLSDADFARAQANMEKANKKRKKQR